MTTLDGTITAAAGQGVDLGDPELRLRHLDAVLWMHGVQAGKESR